MQLGELMEHASFHAETYGDDFVIFLSKHYGELKEQHNREHKEERKDHEQLPFNHQCGNHSFTGTVFYVTDYVPHASPIISDTTAFFFYGKNYSSLSESNIFQPPRTV